MEPLKSEHELQVNQHDLLDSLCKERRNDLKLLTREKLLSLSRSIEVKAFRTLMMRFMPTHLDRPYGLPLNWRESSREQIWEDILKHIDEPQDVINVSESCDLFQRLLEDKYCAAKLAEAAEVCAQKNLLHSETLLELRLVCRTSKKFVDKWVIDGRLNEWSRDRDHYLIPGVCLNLSAYRLDIQLPRFSRILSSLELQNVRIGTFPLRSVGFVDDGRHPQLQILLNMVTRLLELVGDSIHSLGYFSKQNSSDTYNILRKWVSLLPNLEEITMAIGGPPGTDLIKPFEPFPTLPRLRYFWEHHDGGFSGSHLAEILRANPSIRILKLGTANFDRGKLLPETRLESLMAEGILDHHQLQMFSVESSSSIDSFFMRQIAWPLTELRFRLDGSDVMPAGTFFKFVNQFGATLKNLEACVILSNEDTSDAGGTKMMILPNLTKLTWWLSTDSKDLSFMIPLKKLEYFTIELSGQTTLRLEGIWKYLETFHIPLLYPALRKVLARDIRTGGIYRMIWRSGERV